MCCMGVDVLQETGADVRRVRYDQKVVHVQDAGSPVAILILVGSDGPQGMALPDVSVALPDVSNF